MIIASAFLPETLQNHEGYSKADIIHMLLLHDVHEAYLGDKPSISKRPEDVARENQCMARLAGWATIDGLDGVREWARIWADWREGHTINSRIAHDIDAIESYLQMCQYNARKDCTIGDAELWAREVEEALSPEGARIFELLRHREAPLLAWHSLEDQGQQLE